MTQQLKNWIPEGAPFTWEWFQIWEMSRYTQLPFVGGWNDQPAYVQRDFKLYLQVGSWWATNRELPDTTGLPNAEDI